MQNIEMLLNLQVHLFARLVRMISKSDLVHLKTIIEESDKKQTYEEQLHLIEERIEEIESRKKLMNKK